MVDQLMQYKVAWFTARSKYRWKQVSLIECPMNQSNKRTRRKVSIPEDIGRVSEI
jgi:hypothetical protein